MNKRLDAPIGILLVLSAGLACSILRPKRPLTWHLTLQVDAPASDRAAATKQAITVIEKRLDAFGVSNFEVKPQGDFATGRILVNLPAMPDRNRLTSLITVEGKLELASIISPPSPAPVQTYATKEEAVASLTNGGTIPTNRRVLPYLERMSGAGAVESGKWVVVEAPAIITGSDLGDSSSIPAGAERDGYQVQFSLNKAGAERFGSWTGAHVNDYLGITLDGEVRSIVFIKSQISDRGVISGGFTWQAAQDLALILKTGALPGRVSLLEETNDK